jgi:hypothetical protein
MRLGDLFSVASDLKLSNTETSNMAFANLSACFGLGAEARKWLKGRVLKDLPELTQLMLATKPARITEEMVYPTYLRRLQALRDLTAEHHCKLVVVIPTTNVRPEEADCTNAVERAGSLVGIPVVVPVRPNTLSRAFYSDGFHLNERGAEILTPAFVSAIRKEFLVADGRANSGGSTR